MRCGALMRQPVVDGRTTKSQSSTVKSVGREARAPFYKPLSRTKPFSLLNRLNVCVRSSVEERICRPHSRALPERTEGAAATQHNTFTRAWPMSFASPSAWWPDACFRFRVCWPEWKRKLGDGNGRKNLADIHAPTYTAEHGKERDVCYWHLFSLDMTKPSADGRLVAGSGASGKVRYLLYVMLTWVVCVWRTEK